MKLKVVLMQDRAEAYRDIIRVHENHRLDERGGKVGAGQICRVSNGRHSTLAWVRGDEGAESLRRVQVDELHRRRLHIGVEETADFLFEPAGLWGRAKWAWGASEIGYRYATRLSFLGLALGVVGLILGIISLV